MPHVAEARFTPRPSSTAPTAVWVRPRWVPRPWSRRPRVRSNTTADSGRTAWQASQENTENRWVATDAGWSRSGSSAAPAHTAAKVRTLPGLGATVDAHPWREPGDGETERGTGRGVTDGEHAITVAIITAAAGAATRIAASPGAGDPSRRPGGRVATSSCRARWRARRRHRPRRTAVRPARTERRHPTGACGRLDRPAGPAPPRRPGVAVSSPRADRRLQLAGSPRAPPGRRAAGPSAGRAPSPTSTAPAGPPAWPRAPRSPSRVARCRLDGGPHVVEPGAGLRAAREHRRAPRRGPAARPSAAPPPARAAAARAARSCWPSALFTAMTSASSRMPFLIPCSWSPVRAIVSSRNVSTIPATATSDWPTPTVSTSTTS